jgi:hypothetical protein
MPVCIETTGGNNFLNQFPATSLRQVEFVLYAGKYPFLQGDLRTIHGEKPACEIMANAHSPTLQAQFQLLAAIMCLPGFDGTLCKFGTE